MNKNTFLHNAVRRFPADELRGVLELLFPLLSFLLPIKGAKSCTVLHNAALNTNHTVLPELLGQIMKYSQSGELVHVIHKVVLRM